MVPFCTDRSEWQTPEATIFTLASPGPGGGDLDVVVDLEVLADAVQDCCGDHVLPPGSITVIGDPSVPPAPGQGKPGSRLAYWIPRWRSSRSAALTA